MRARLAVLAAACLLFAGCAGSGDPVPLPPPVEAGGPVGPAMQPIPQLSDAQSQTPMTVCLAPPGSGLRAFLSRDGHGRQIVDVENVWNLAPENPWSCP